jgi:hypothetical protein
MSTFMLLLLLLNGRYYILKSLLLKLLRLKCWLKGLAGKFIVKQVLKFKRILTAKRQADIKD